MQCNFGWGDDGVLLLLLLVVNCVKIWIATAPGRHPCHVGWGTSMRSLFRMNRGKLCCFLSWQRIISEQWPNSFSHTYCLFLVFFCKFYTQYILFQENIVISILGRSNKINFNNCLWKETNYSFRTVCFNSWSSLKFYLTFYLCSI